MDLQRSKAPHHTPFLQKAIYRTKMTYIVVFLPRVLLALRKEREKYEGDRREEATNQRKAETFFRKGEAKQRQQKTTDRQASSASSRSEARNIHKRACLCGEGVVMCLLVFIVVR